MVLYGTRDTPLAKYVPLHVLFGPHKRSVLCETSRVKALLHSQHNTEQPAKIFVTLRYHITQCFLWLSDLPVQELLKTSQMKTISQ